MYWSKNLKLNQTTMKGVNANLNESHITNTSGTMYSEYDRDRLSIDEAD
jgi:hypothetical protein